MNAILKRKAGFTTSMCLAMSMASTSVMAISISGINAETGHTVSGTVDWSVSGSTLTIDITNTSAPTATNGDVLSGILFTPSDTALSLSSVVAPGGVKVWTDKSTSTDGGVFTGAWTTVFGVSPPPAGSVGAAETGFGGMFSAGSITLGTGGADYGIVSNGTYPQSGGGPGNPNQYSLADNMLRLTFTGVNDLSNLNLGNITLLFGTSGAGYICNGQDPDCGLVPPSEVPVPAAVWLFGSGLLGMIGVARRKAA